jgi:hypothetical protein
VNTNALRTISILNSAYLVVGSVAPTRNAVVAVLEARGVKVVANPDVYEFSGSEFNVDDARAVSSFASLKPYGDAKYFLLAMNRATAEAQNALLKVIEEAPGSSIFFFIVESAGHLLPTIRSRCIQVLGERVESEENAEEAQKFLRDSFESRLSAVEKMTSYISKTQDRAPSRTFVRLLLKSAKDKKYPAPNLRDILDADRFMRMQGSSAKAVLSHLAVSLPRG